MTRVYLFLVKLIVLSCALISKRTRSDILVTLSPKCLRQKSTTKGITKPVLFCVCCCQMSINIGLSPQLMKKIVLLKLLLPCLTQLVTSGRVHSLNHFYSGAKHIQLTSQRPFSRHCSIGAPFSFLPDKYNKVTELLKIHFFWYHIIMHAPSGD